MKTEANLICQHCEKPAVYNRLFLGYWCPDCRLDDVTEAPQCVDDQ